MNSPKSADEASGSRILCFEAIRGLAAFGVVVGHCLLAFWTAEGKNWTENPALWRQAVDKIFYNGDLFVSIFFVLSGFVLSLAYFRTRSDSALRSGAVRRYPRLMIPAGASIVLMIVLTNCGLLYNRQAAQQIDGAYGLTEIDSGAGACIDANAGAFRPNSWLGEYGTVPSTILLALREIGWKTFINGSAANAVLWTMPIELAGSFLLYAFLAFFGPLRNRWLLYGICGALLIAIDRIFMLDFLLGAAMCDLWVLNQKKWKLALPVVPALVLVAVAIFFVRWNWASSVLIIGATAASPGMQRLLEARWLGFLGKVSFGLYVIHMPVLCSLGCWVYLLLCRDLGWGHMAGAAASIAVTVVGTLFASWLFYHSADRAGRVVAAAIDVQMFRPRPVDTPVLQKSAPAQIEMPADERKDEKRAA